MATIPATEFIILKNRMPAKNRCILHATSMSKSRAHSAYEDGNKVPLSFPLSTLSGGSRSTF